MSNKAKGRQQRRKPPQRRSDGSRRFWWLAIAGAAVLLALVAVVGFAGGGSDEPAAGPKAPDVELVDFDGNVMRISDLEGGPAVLNFWASWCVPCLAEMPGFEQVYQRHIGTVQFLGINLTDDRDAALAVVELTGVTYPLAQDLDGSAFTAFGAIGMPTTVFLSPAGEILETVTGEITAEQLEGRIERYFGA